MARARRAVSQGLSFSPDTKTVDMEKDPGQVVEALRQVMVRVNKLEAAAQPEGTEFEVQLTDSGGLVELPHGLKTTAVRWYVVGWFCGAARVSPNLQPNLVYDPLSTPTSLFLRSYVAGRAIIRVEPSQSAVEPGQTIDATGAPTGRLRNRIQIVGTASTTILTVPFPDNGVAVFSCCVIGKNITTPATNLRELTTVSGYRDAAGAIINLTATIQHSVIVAGMTYTFTVAAGNLVVAVQCTVAAQTVNWDAMVEPVHTLHRDSL